jgi:hypothetical protein
VSYLLGFLLAIQVVAVIYPPAILLLMVAVVVFIALELAAGLRGRLG